MKIGIIGAAGDMGSNIAAQLSKAGYDLLASDLPEKRTELERIFSGTDVKICENGNEVARKSDYTIFSVETKNIGQAIGRYAPSLKENRAAGGFTSAKTPEIEAVEANCPEDISWLTLHIEKQKSSKRIRNIQRV